MIKLFRSSPTRTPWRPAHPGAPDLNRQLWRLASFLAGIIGLAALFQRAPALLLDFESAWLATAIYLGILFTLPLLGLLWVRQAWRTAGLWQSTQASTRNPIALRVASVLGMIGLAMFFIAHSFAAPTQVRIFHARQAFNQYVITTDLAAGVVRVSGLIGPNLASKLNAVLTRTPSIRSIEITSPGGLLEETLRAAAVIERHSPVTVIARKTCNGACLPILLAGTRRYADWDMDLGVDQVRAITAMPRAVDQNRMMQTALDVDQYFADKGLPKNLRFVVRTADAQGLMRESAIRLAEERVLDGVMDGTQPLPLATAKWRAVEQSVQRSDQAAGLQALLTTARDAGSSFAEAHADALYAALLTNDPARLRDSICGLAAPLATLHISVPEDPACR